MTAWIALIISVASLSLSSFLAWRDRSKIRAIAHPHEHEITGEYSNILVSISNCGRRQIIVRSLIGKYRDGSQGGMQLSEGGVRLQEGEFYEFKFGKYDGIMVNGDNMSGLVDFLLKDSTGKKHKIKSSAKAIQLVSSSKHPFGIRTHG